MGRSLKRSLVNYISSRKQFQNPFQQQKELSYLKIVLIVALIFISLILLRGVTNLKFYRFQHDKYWENHLTVRKSNILRILRVNFLRSILFVRFSTFLTNKGSTKWFTYLWSYKILIIDYQQGSPNWIRFRTNI